MESDDMYQVLNFHFDEKYRSYSQFKFIARSSIVFGTATLINLLEQIYTYYFSEGKTFLTKVKFHLDIVCKVLENLANQLD